LHDALEGTVLAPEELAREFGEKVRSFVEDVTEPRLPGLSWETRKARYLRRLEAAPHGSMLVACADAIATLIAMAPVRGAAAARTFDTPPALTLGFYRQVYPPVTSAWAGCPLLDELRNRLEEAERKLLAPAG